MRFTWVMQLVSLKLHAKLIRLELLLLLSGFQPQLLLLGQLPTKMSQRAEGSSPFLDLSRELRDNVYEVVLLSSRPPPSSPECEGAWKNSGSMVRSSFEYHNHYSADGYQSTSAPLLRTCRQINEEVAEAVVRLTKLNHLLYRLDLMLLDERKLSIIWLAFPHSTTNIPRLDVDF